MTLKIGAFRVHAEAQAPEKATDFAACYDLRTYLDKVVNGYNKENDKITLKVETDADGKFIFIEPGYRLLMPTGFIFEIPEFHSLRFHPRSGLSLKKGISLANAEAIIDEDYVKENYILLCNNSNVAFKAYHTERLCQMEIVNKIESEIEITDIAPQKRGNRTGGMGHSGTM